MHSFFQHLRINILRGLWAMVPILLSVGALTLFYKLVDKKIIGFLNNYFDVRQIPGFGILLVLILLYFIGLITTNVIGKQFLHLFERLSARIPIINHIYTVSKKLGDIIGNDTEKEVFRKGLLINYPNANQWTIALLAGKIKDSTTGENWCKVYVPMAHPVIGFVYLVKEKDVLDPGWSAQDTFKMVLTLGLVAPSATVPA